jgi:hypothetical protein
MPVNTLILRALTNLYTFYGDEFKVQCPTGSGRYMTLFEVAQEIVRRLAGTFVRDTNGRRPVYGGTAKFQEDPHWRDLILFYEYFHGDNGAGLGASHQTGWTALVAPLLDLFARFDATTLLETAGQHRPNLNNLALVYDSQGSFSEAISLFRTAIRVCEGLLILRNHADPHARP